MEFLLLDFLLSEFFFVVFSWITHQKVGHLKTYSLHETALWNLISSFISEEGMSTKNTLSPVGFNNTSAFSPSEDACQCY